MRTADKTFSSLRGVLAAGVAASVVAALGAQSLMAAPAPSAAASKAAAARLAAQNLVDRPRPRILVTSDLEIDDVASWHRFFLYVNEWDIAGLVSSSSRFHWLGDPAAGIAFNSWAGHDVFDQIINGKGRYGAGGGYAAAYQNLRRHDPRYPSPAELMSKVREGNITNVGEMAKDTPGSELIKQVLLDNNMAPLHLQAWGGTNTIAAALRSIEQQYKSTPQWRQVYDKVVAKARLYIILDQDATYKDYIIKNWPDLYTIYNRDQFWSMAYAQFRNTRVPRWLEDETMGAPFMSQFVKGPLLQSYPITGAGRGGGLTSAAAPPPGAIVAPAGGGQAAAAPAAAAQAGRGGAAAPAGQAAPAAPAAGPAPAAGQAAAAGGRAGGQPAAPAAPPVPPRLPGTFNAEGDTPSYLYVLNTGLRSDEDPSYGGWSGRFAKVSKNIWTDRPSSIPLPGENVRDTVPGFDTPAYAMAAPLTRWFPQIQNNFFARAQWVTHAPADSNHEPVVRVTKTNGNLSVRAGQVVTLSAQAADPDGNAIATKWWQYREAGSYPGAEVQVTPAAVTVTNGASNLSARLTVPADAKPGESIHIIAEVTDNGAPVLTHYGRFILTVR